MTHKDIFIKRYAQLGGSCPLASIPDVIRVNTLRINEQELVKRLSKKGVVLRKIKELSCAYRVVKSPFSVGAATEHLLGYYYVQNEAAQYPVEVLMRQTQDGERWRAEDEGQTVDGGRLTQDDGRKMVDGRRQTAEDTCVLLQPNQNAKHCDTVLPTTHYLPPTVLDMCASPGGKTTQLADLMNNKGIIIALEKKKERIERLKTNLERQGVHNAILYHTDASNVKKLGITFDKVLLDAPCSGNYTQEDGWFEKRTLSQVNKNAAEQKILLSAALSVLKKGGTLVYSTCSLEPEENELVIDWLLKQSAGHRVSILDTDISAGEAGLTTVFGKTLHKDLKKCRRFWPSKTGTEGFFIAKVMKV